MTEFWIDDLDVFFRDFGFEATIGGASTKVIFDEAYLGEKLFRSEVETSVLQVIAKSADVAGVAHGDTVTISGESFIVRGIQPDGTGMTVLLLSRD